MNKIFFILFISLISTNLACNEEVRISSNDKFEVIKSKKFTQVNLLKGNDKIEIFNKVMRDNVIWIYSVPKKENSYIIITRPMVAGAEHSRFWLISKGQTRLIGKTECVDHKIDDVNFEQIRYRCFFDDPKKPLQVGSKKIVYSLR